MFVRETNDWIWNVIIIVIVVIALIILVVVIVFSKARKNLILAQPGATYTGSHMPCSSEVQCQSGLVCTETSLGSMCLSPVGGICKSLTQCVNQASICDGRCVAETGGLGSLCLNTPCQDGYSCSPDSQGNNRCFIPQNSPLVCASFYDCVPGSVCEGGVCLSGVEPYGFCTGLECAGSNHCVNGNCQPLDISTPGTIGSYCSDDKCQSGLICEISSFYQLPSGVGYCVNPVSLPGQICNRFVGCLPVGHCDEALCVLPESINECPENLCSGGYTCSVGKCGALEGVGCDQNSDCLSGTCNQTYVQLLTVSNYQNIYTWAGQINVPALYNWVSMIEYYNQGTTTRTMGFYQNNVSQLTVYNADLTTAIYPIVVTGPEIRAPYVVKNIQLSQSGAISMQINCASSYDVLIQRQFSQIAPYVTNIIDLTEDESKQYFDQGNSYYITNITYYNFDFVGNYFYLVASQNHIYAFSIVDQILIKIKIVDFPVVYLAHFVSTYTTSYDPASLAVATWRTDLTGELGYYLWFIKNFDLNVYLGFNIPQIALTFSLNNPVERFQFFTQDADGYHYFQTSPIVKKQVAPGYIGENQQSNFLQSIASPFQALNVTKACSN